MEQKFEKTATLSDYSEETLLTTSPSYANLLGQSYIGGTTQNVPTPESVHSDCCQHLATDNNIAYGKALTNVCTGTLLGLLMTTGLESCSPWNPMAWILALFHVLGNMLELAMSIYQHCFMNRLAKTFGPAPCCINYFDVPAGATKFLLFGFALAKASVKCNSGATSGWNDIFWATAGMTIALFFSALLQRFISG